MCYLRRIRDLGVVVAGALMLLTHLGAVQAAELSRTVYYRQLVYNHVSPYMPLRGLYEISAETAKLSPHYIFTYDDKNRIIEIINNNPEKWKSHQLTHLKIHRVAITYLNNQEIRTFFDESGQLDKNIRGVYKEVYTYDKNGFKSAADFYDADDRPMNSLWNIAHYTWAKKGELIVERRYDVSGIPQPISPYFKFGTIGILLDARGFSRATYNLNDKLEIVNNEVGVASYQDTYDEVGNHVAYAYYDQDNRLTNQPIFALGKKSYDKNGNVLKEELLDVNYKVKRQMLFSYDDNGFLKE